MSGLKLNAEDKNSVEIVRGMLELLEPWHKLINKPSEISIFSTDELKRNVALVEQIIDNSNLDELEFNIINDTLINKKHNMDKTGRKYYYSDSGLRNQVNLILKKIVDSNFN